MNVVCAVHGEVEWHGDVSCVSCKEIYFCDGVVEDPSTGKKKRTYSKAPQKGLCNCGKRLFGGTEFTMRPMCRLCATMAVVAAKNGKES